MTHVVFSIYRDKDEPSLSYLELSSSFVEADMSARFNIESAIDVLSFLKATYPNLQSWRGKLLRNAS